MTSAPPGDLKAVEREEWVKTTWKKGERREEIKLTAEASGLAFDDASMVVRIGGLLTCSKLRSTQQP